MNELENLVDVLVEDGSDHHVYRCYVLVSLRIILQRGFYELFRAAACSNKIISVAESLQFWSNDILAYQKNAQKRLHGKENQCSSVLSFNTSECDLLSYGIEPVNEKLDMPIQAHFEALGPYTEENATDQFSASYLEDQAIVGETNPVQAAVKRARFPDSSESF